MESIFSQIDLLGPFSNGSQLKAEIDGLEAKKNKLLTKIINIEHIIGETNDPMVAKGQILKILDS